MDSLLRQWNESYFDGQLSSEVLNIFEALALSTQSETVKGVLERWFRALKLTHFQATDFTDDLARSLYSVLNIFTKTWDGIPPPVTFAGRHIKIDTYITCNRWWQFPLNGKLLDLGCGFPPHTAVETAKKLPEWQITGADPAIPHFIVYDEQDDYATFNKTGDLLYFQGHGKRFGTFTQDPVGTRAYFSQLFRTLMSKHKEIGVKEGKPAELNEARLMTNPVGAYESPNLSFQTAGIGEVDIQGVDVVRCFNVLVYFDRPFRNEALSWFTEILREGGLLLCGLNSFFSRSSRYTVFQREQGRLFEKEFAFGIDNLRVSSEVIPWWAFHNDEVEMNRQAILVKQIRADPAFRRDFDSRLDALLAEHRLFKRGTDGYLTSWGPEMPKDKNERLARINDQLDQEGYVEGAVKVLAQAGYDAWRNCIGHISVDLAQFEV